ncbi:MAG: DUF167 domain-containing protein [Alphaproteobacteria bacterium]|nr:DUF167 domain-containing protein [Alphaproteobacteria bacterium]
MAFYQTVEKGYVLRVRLTPNSSCTQTTGEFVDENGDSWLKISVKAVPEKGKANKELLAFLAKKLKVAKSSVELIYGQTDRYKKIMIENTPDMAQKIEGLLK